MYQNDSQKVLTCEVRLSYANLVTPRKVNPANPEEPAKYSVTLLIPKTETACYEDIMQSIKAANDAAVNSVWGGVQPQYQPIIHDGDGVRRNGTPYGDECKGHWVLTASTSRKPQVIHVSNLNAELAPQDIYSGMYGRVTVRFYGYKKAGGIGIGCGLGNVMKTRDGEPLGGNATAASDFAGLEQAAANPVEVAGMGYWTPQTAPVQPQTPQVPQAPQMPQNQGFGGWNSAGYGTPNDYYNS